jgi:cytochrome c
VRVSPDGTRAITGSFDYAAMVWDISGATPRRLHRLDAHEGAVNAVAFLPDNAHAVTAGDDGSLRLWDLASGQLVHRFPGHEGKVNAVSISADGRYAATASWDRTARIWNLASRSDGPVLTGHKGPVNAVAFSHDGATVFTASYDGTVAAWQRETGKFLRPVYKHGWGINVLERLDDSDRLIFGALNGSAGIIDAATGDILAELPAHTRPVLSLAVVAKPGLVATGGGDGVIRVIRQDDWTVLETFENPYGPVWALSFLNDGRGLYHAGLDDFAALWQIAPRKPFEPVDSPFPRRFQIDAGVSEGERQFARKCSICHTLAGDSRNRAGPTLAGVFGRKAGTVAGYPYSPALANSDIVWNEDSIGKLFELGPDHYTPGSKMPLQKITDAATRQALIDFLKAATQSAPAPAGDPSGQKGTSQ